MLHAGACKNTGRVACAKALDRACVLSLITAVGGPPILRQPGARRIRHRGLRGNGLSLVRLPGGPRYAPAALALAIRARARLLADLRRSSGPGCLHIVGMADRSHGVVGSAAKRAVRAYFCFNSRRRFARTRCLVGVAARDAAADAPCPVASAK